jgi:hypothetical protein
MHIDVVKLAQQKKSSWVNLFILNKITETSSTNLFTTTVFLYTFYLFYNIKMENEKNRSRNRKIITTGKFADIACKPQILFTNNIYELAAYIK